MGGGHRLRGGPWALLAWATGRASDASKCRSCSSLPCSQGYSSPADLDDVPVQHGVLDDLFWSSDVEPFSFIEDLQHWHGSAATETEAKAVISFMVGY
ncbi:hypothetical protein PAHAL_7G134500 [Panicum hallii]|uniref:Uncharacterized protein n=1 Tax=Panicum hallii TaxID=206008 RepID=A0A2T8IC41_9POAL|nr:hypothetical protein PAHAL_7G134500 [Panicum hallii]PVH35244.1 hypothetical protein PAHAL_7G134500 [Panicum hallii]